MEKKIGSRRRKIWVTVYEEREKAEGGQDQKEKKGKVTFGRYVYVKLKGHISSFLSYYFHTPTPASDWLRVCVNPRALAHCSDQYDDYMTRFTNALERENSRNYSRLFHCTGQSVHISQELLKRYSKLCTVRDLELLSFH